jgi:hypothetical protein
MGLELVEFLMSTEEAFGVEISDAAAPDLNTPRRLIDYLAGRLPVAPAGCCLSQRAFQQLRAAVTKCSPVPRSCLRPKTSLLGVWPAPERGAAWAAVRNEVGARHWPRLAQPGWIGNLLSPRLHLLGDVARFMVARNPLALKRPGEGWTRAQVAEVVHRLIGEELGIPPKTYTDDSRWVQDMGVD